MRSFPFYIARRYLFSKHKRNAINIISAISVVGVALATTALVCVMSGFNGFQDLIGSLFTAFDPQLELVPRQSKAFSADTAAVRAVKADPDVAAVSACYEDNALILFRGRPLVIRLKGVDDAFAEVTDIQTILYGKGTYRLHAANLEYGIPGYGLTLQMGGVDFGTMQICVPKKGSEKINALNPIENINVSDLQASGLCFQVHQQRYDNNMMLSSLGFAQNLFGSAELTSLSIRLRDGADESAVKARLQRAVGSGFQVRDRYEQHEETFNVMQIEKLFAFAFLTFIVLVACFNIIGSVSMLIIDKRQDALTLRNLGATQRDIVRIFLLEGRLICMTGAVVGMVLGLVLCALQQNYGLLRLGNGDGSFIIDAYPVSVHVLDIAIVFLTVVVVGFVSVWYPVRYLSRRIIAG